MYIALKDLKFKVISYAYIFSFFFYEVLSLKREM